MPASSKRMAVLSFSQSTARRSSSAFRASLFAGCRYARRRSSASKGKLQQACNNHGSAHNDHIGGSWRHQAENQRQKAQRQQEHAINAVAHCPLLACRAFRGVSSDAVCRIPHSGAAPPALSFQTLVQQFCGFSVHSRIIVVAYLKKIHGASSFRNRLIESARKFHSQHIGLPLGSPICCDVLIVPCMRTADRLRPIFQTGTAGIRSPRPPFFHRGRSAGLRC